MQIKHGERLLIVEGCIIASTYEVHGIGRALRDIDLTEELCQFQRHHTQVLHDIGPYDWYEIKRQFLAHLVVTHALCQESYREINLDECETRDPPA